MADVDACPGVFASRHPTEQELIASYLPPRLLTKSSSPPRSRHFIHHADAYAADPADLTARFLPARAADGAKAWYFFSPVRTTTERGTRRARAVESGEGCWHAESGVRAVVDASGRRVGHRQFFSFVKKREDGKRVRSGWLMVELGLDRGTKDASNSASDELVLCKIYMTPRMPSSPPSAVMSTMELPEHKRKTTDEIAPATLSPLQQRRRYDGTQDGSKESSGESVVMLSDDGSRSEESPDDCVMLADARDYEQHSAQGESAVTNLIAGRSDGMEHCNDCTQHGKLLPDLNVAIVAPDEEEGHARGGFPQEASTMMAAGDDRSTTTGYLPAGYRRTLMLFLEEDGVEGLQQPPAPPAATTGAELQRQQPPSCCFVVHPCAAHAKMRHGATYGCGCRVTGSVRRGGYHLPRRAHTTTGQ